MRVMVNVGYSVELKFQKFQKQSYFHVTSLLEHVSTQLVTTQRQVLSLVRKALDRRSPDTPILNMEKKKRGTKREKSTKNRNTQHPSQWPTFFHLMRSMSPVISVLDLVCCIDSCSVKPRSNASPIMQAHWLLISHREPLQGTLLPRLCVISCRD